LLLVFIDEVMFLEEAIEGSLGFVERVALLEDFVVVGATVSVVENLESFIDLMERCLRFLNVIFVALWQPLVGQLLIGTLDLEGGSGVRDSEDFVVVLHCRFAHYLWSLTEQLYQ
jgi:hypothetical protein